MAATAFPLARYYGTFASVPPELRDSIMQTLRPLGLDRWNTALNSQVTLLIAADSERATRHEQYLICAALDKPRRNS
jgi:hypothetical protein